MAWSANKLQVKWPVALFPPTPCGTESEGLSRALEATRLPQRAEGPSEVGEGRAGAEESPGRTFQRPTARDTIIRGRGCQKWAPWALARFGYVVCIGMCGML